MPWGHVLYVFASNREPTTPDVSMQRHIKRSAKKKHHLETQTAASNFRTMSSLGEANIYTKIEWSACLHGQANIVLQPTNSSLPSFLSTSTYSA